MGLGLSIAKAVVDVIGRIIGDEPGYQPLMEHLELAAITTVAGSAIPASRLNWAWDELVLACDLVARNDWKSLRKNDLRISALRSGGHAHYAPRWPRRW